MEFPYRNVSPLDQQKESWKRWVQFITEFVYPYHPYYRKIFKELNLHPKDLKDPQDLRQIPITEKKNLAENLKGFILQPTYPGKKAEFDVETISPEKMEIYKEKSLQANYIRDRVGKPRSPEEKIYQTFLREWQPIHFQWSGGSSGTRSVSTYTHHDLFDAFLKVSAMGMYIAGHEPDMKWLNLAPGAPHLGIYQTMIVPLLDGWPSFNTFGGKSTPTETQIQLADQEKYQGLLGITSYVTYWLEVARQMLNQGKIGPLDSFKIVVVMGEPVVPAYVQRLRDQFASLGSHPRIIECMGSTELKSAFFECDEGTKLHLNPEFYYWEVLNPETREPVPWGEPGVLVFSHIDWRGTVLLRFWTGDYISGGVVWDECPRCGLVGPRAVTPITRAAKDFVKIRGARVELLDLQTAVRKCREVESFQIRIGKEDEKDPFSRDWVKVYIAPRPGYSEEQVRASVGENVRRDTEVTPNEFIFLPGKELEGKLFARTGIKADWIVDERKI